MNNKRNENIIFFNQINNKRKVIKNITNNICIKKQNIINDNIKEPGFINNYKEEYKKHPIYEYDETIMKNLFLEENNNRADYQKIINIIKEENNPIERNICINLAITLCEYFKLRQETFYLSINIFDRYILKIYESKAFNNNKIKIIMLTCVFIASKYEEIYPPSFEDYLEIFDFFYY
jgi:G2/mitotic-specific cyclin 1/2